MLERLSELPDGVEGLSAKGTVEKEDYDEVVEPMLREAHREGRRLRLLYHFGPEFDGFSAAAAWEDTRLGLRYLRRFERCAIVSDIDWIRQSSRLIGTLMPCPVRIFGNDKWQDAVEWLSSPGGGNPLSHRLLPEAGVLIVEPDDRLRVEDFDAVAATVDSWIESEGSLRGIVVHARTFPGWENLKSFIRHLTFVREHHRKIDRVAFAADGKVAEIAPKLSEHFVKADVKQFPYDEFDRAVAWASAEGGKKT